MKTTAALFLMLGLVIAIGQSVSPLKQRQLDREALAETRRAAWEAHKHEGSSNHVCKVSIMLSPMNDRHQIIEQRIISYFDEGKLFYATGAIDRARNNTNF